MNSVTIVNYHYIRDFANSRFPNLKGCGIDKFTNHMKYLAEHYTPVTMGELLLCLEGRKDLPKNAAMVTFDDGYLDHFTTAFPILEYYGIKGNFYVCEKTCGILKNSELLDVNRIQLLLASTHSITLVSDIKTLLWEYGTSNNLKPFDVYYEEWGKPGTYDDEDTMFVKRMLQTVLPIKIRKKIIGRMFAKYVPEKESVLTSEMYMNYTQLRCLQKHGHHIGGHTQSHPHLGNLNLDDQRHEIRKSFGLLDGSLSMDSLTFCYPYGSHNEITKELLKFYTFSLAFGVNSEIAIIGQDDPYNLPRLDCNDFEKLISK